MRIIRTDVIAHEMGTGTCVFGSAVCLCFADRYRKNETTLTWIVHDKRADKIHMSYVKKEVHP